MTLLLRLDSEDDWNGNTISKVLTLKGVISRLVELTDHSDGIVAYRVILCLMGVTLDEIEQVREDLNDCPLSFSVV